MSTRHLFALYVENLSDSVSTIPQQIRIEDAQLIVRITKVLRLRAGDECILFDRIHHAKSIIEVVEKKYIVLNLVDFEVNQPLKPRICVLLPLLKKNYLQEAIYGLVEVGVTEIRLIKTAKSHDKWFNEREFQRLQKIIIAAAEQSNHYIFPMIYEPRSFHEVIPEIAGLRFFLDPDGRDFGSVFNDLKKEKVSPTEISILVGPEGDLSAEEKEFVIQEDFISVRLTLTILRAYQAVILGAGMIRVAINY